MNIPCAPPPGRPTAHTHPETLTSPRSAGNSPRWVGPGTSSVSSELRSLQAAKRTRAGLGRHGLPNQCPDGLMAASSHATCSQSQSFRQPRLVQGEKTKANSDPGNSAGLRPLRFAR